MCQWVTGTEISTRDLIKFTNVNVVLNEKRRCRSNKLVQGWKTIIATSKWQTRETVNWYRWPDHNDLLNAAICSINLIEWMICTNNKFYCYWRFGLVTPTIWLHIFGLRPLIIHQKVFSLSTLYKQKSDLQYKYITEIMGVHYKHNLTHQLICIKKNPRVRLWSCGCRHICVPTFIKLSCLSRLHEGATFSVYINLNPKLVTPWLNIRIEK